MKLNMKSIRPFIGAQNFNISRDFYRDLGFEEVVLEPKLSLFQKQDIAFYLQDYYTKDWVDNTMIFVEVENVEEFWSQLVDLQLGDQYPTARLSPIKTMEWGSECFLHDPSGILWHFGQFAK
ncbi:glyoxalase [Chryseobacterium fluminis]|uniref:glyoxalase n=1 Tax=Chryseobacterium fluminis TaxID=2983606 RepID=UPI00225B4296|nr:glyoxalase [Chryseobacterium sp. MMS21-Ot14]UZT98244.1 glyoxalase [Chryseobacterium sp. MMS21-Ot14]